MNNKDSLEQYINLKLDYCLKNIDNTKPGNLHKLLLTEVEKILFKFILIKTDNNYSKASKILGINRNTLKKKMNAYEN